MHDRGGSSLYEHQPIRLQVQKSYSKDNHLPLQDSRNKTKTWQNSKCVLEFTKHKRRRFLNAFICRQISAIISLRIHTWSLMTTTATVTRNQQQKIFWMTIIKIYNQVNKQPFEDVQTEVEWLMKEHVPETTAQLTNLTRIQINTSVCLPWIPPSRDATCPWYLTQLALAFCFELFTILQLFVTTVSQL